MGKDVSRLATHGPERNVNLSIEDVARVMNEELTPRIVDFIEIAAYVYAADSIAKRDGAWTDDHSVEPWDRTLSFVIAVRDPIFWSRSDVKQLLMDTLRFLSDDKYAFDFPQLVDEQLKQAYLQFGEQDDWPFRGADRVLMFSGGLDSLAGAVETATRGEKLVLVSHRPVAKLGKRQRELYVELRKRFPVPMIHVPVWINKSTNISREFTQRTRSFLFAALGVAVANSLQAGGVRFFENGIVSLNLPVADEVLRARASRTTHPETLDLLSRLCRLVLDREFIIDNPYLYKTKTEVVSILREMDAGPLIRYTCSCAHTGLFQSKTQWHCGTCSQCIDRRIAVLAAGQESYDPEHDYVSDVFTGPRKQNYEKNIAVDYARHACELDRMSDVEMATRFNLGLSRAARTQPKRSDAVDQFIRMHQSHGATVMRVLRRQLQASAGRLLDGTLDNTSMLALIAGQQHLKPSWSVYCDRIVHLLSNGIPIACAKHKPKDEKHLQDIADGILRADGSDLVREFPFMRWSSSLTKPDWSSEPLLVWIEAKYIRQLTDIRRITEEIAADITKYGDNERRVQFVVYDPAHVVVDEYHFAEQIQRRDTMRVGFIR